MTKEELEKEAEAFVSEKADKGNFDVEKFGKAYFSESSMKQALVKFTEPREKQISELEKENAELKRDKEDLIFIRNQNAKCMCEDKENLTKAKEIIENLLGLLPDEVLNHDYYKEKYVDPAEQFISEV